MLLERQILPLLLCYACNKEPVQGRTRLQKIIFLIQADHEEWSKYHFIAEAFGPWSLELQEDIDDLVREGLLQERRMATDNGGVKYVYSITQRGSQEVRALLANPNERQKLDKLLRMVESTKKYASHMNLESLISRVHEKYPKLAKGSADFRF